MPRFQPYVWLVCAIACWAPGAPGAAEPENSGHADSGGLRIHYEIFGEGPPLVLVHGWGADTKSNWVDTGWVESLKPHRKLISVDVRGHGQSDKPHELAAYTYAAMSADVLAVMDHLKVAKADLMGYSMGSFMGAYLLGHHADRFTSMVLGGIGDETKESAAAGEMIAAVLREPDPEKIADPMGKLYRAYVDSNPNNTDREALAVSALAMWPDGQPVRIGGEGLGRVTIPVLIVNGSEDRPYIDTMGVIVKAIPGVRVVTIPGADHLQTVVDPKFKEAVIEFLRR